MNPIQSKQPSRILRRLEGKIIETLPAFLREAAGGVY
jgi:hypothetical protein